VDARVLRPSLRRIHRCLLVLLVAEGDFLTRSAVAQTPTGALTVRVNDATGLALDHVRVCLSSPELQRGPEHFNTDKKIKGRFTFLALQPGSYELHVEHDDFQTQHITISISAGESTDRTVMLTAGTKLQVDVAAELQDEAANPLEQNKRTEILQRTPGLRNPLDAVRNVTGVSATSPSSPSSTTVSVHALQVRLLH